jgi:hypothetical protein
MSSFGVISQTGNNIQTEGLVFYVDPAYKKSYPRSGTTTFNLASGSLDGTINGATWDGINPTSSFNFDGTDDFVDCTDNDIFSFTDDSNDFPYTFSAWIYVDSLSTDSNQPNTIISKYATSANEWWFLIENKKLVIINYDQSNPTIIGRKYNTDLVINTWYYVAATYDGSKNVSGFKLYLNGTRVDDTDYNGNTTYGGMQNQTTNVYIGKRDRSDRLSLFNGQTGPINVYNRALSAGDVLQNYNAQKDRFGL